MIKKPQRTYNKTISLSYLCCMHNRMVKHIKKTANKNSVIKMKVSGQIENKLICR